MAAVRPVVNALVTTRRSLEWSAPSMLIMEFGTGWASLSFGACGVTASARLNLWSVRTRRASA